MAKKVTTKVSVSAHKNPAKGGAWMATFTITNEDTNEVTFSMATAWANQRACKGWFKEQVIERTTRKSIKVDVTSVDENEKPTSLHGSLTFKS